MTIRPAAAADALAIHAVHSASFPTAAEADLVTRLEQAGRLPVSLVAEMNGRIVGHIGFSPVTTAAGKIGAGLAPVAVLAEYRRRGIAAELVHAGLQACRERGIGWVVVLGEPHYYARFGFRPATEFGLVDDYGGGAAFQALALAPRAVPVDAGLVSYSPEFAVFG